MSYTNISSKCFHLFHFAQRKPTRSPQYYFDTLPPTAEIDETSGKPSPAPTVSWMPSVWKKPSDMIENTPPATIGSKAVGSKATSTTGSKATGQKTTAATNGGGWTAATTTAGGATATGKKTTGGAKATGKKTTGGAKATGPKTVGAVPSTNSSIGGGAGGGGNGEWNGPKM